VESKPTLLDLGKGDAEKEDIGEEENKKKDQNNNEKSIEEVEILGFTPVLPSSSPSAPLVSNDPFAIDSDDELEIL